MTSEIGSVLAFGLEQGLNHSEPRHGVRVVVNVSVVLYHIHGLSFPPTFFIGAL